MSRPSGTEGVAASGAREIVDCLADQGLRHVFGVTGTSTVSIFNELHNAAVEFVPSMHESIAVAAADGYARVHGSSCTLLYMTQGVANMMASLYNASNDDSPILLIDTQPPDSVQTGLSVVVGEGDAVRLVQDHTRFAARVPVASSLRAWVERGFRMAQSHPGGPVLLSLSEDMLSAPAVAPHDTRRSLRVPAGAPDVSAVADALRTAERPVLIAGGQVSRYGGSAALSELAARLEIPVLREPAFSDALPISPDDPRYTGWAGAGAGSALAQDADVVVLVGCRLVLEGHAVNSMYFPDAELVAHVNVDPEKLEARAVANWSCACSPKNFLEALLSAEDDIPTDEQLLTRRRARADEARAVFRRSEAPPYAAAVHDAMQRGWLVDEALSLSPALNDALRGSETRYMAASGASLGWGVGAAVGAALASDGPVTCVTGDGALRFAANGLWTASALNLPITYVVWDNGGFGSTRSFERMYVRSLDDPNAKAHYVGSDYATLGVPVESILEGYGVPTVRVGPHDDIRRAVVDAWDTADKGPNAVVVDVGYDAGAF